MLPDVCRTRKDPRLHTQYHVSDIGGKEEVHCKSGLGAAFLHGRERLTRGGLESRQRPPCHTDLPPIVHVEKRLAEILVVFGARSSPCLGLHQFIGTYLRPCSMQKLLQDPLRRRFTYRRPPNRLEAANRPVSSCQDGNRPRSSDPLDQETRPKPQLLITIENDDRGPVPLPRRGQQ